MSAVNNQRKIKRALACMLVASFSIIATASIASLRTATNKLEKEAGLLDVTIEQAQDQLRDVNRQITALSAPTNNYLVASQQLGMERTATAGFIRLDVADSSVMSAHLPGVLSGN